MATLAPLPDPVSLEANSVKTVEADPVLVNELRKTIKDLESEMATLKNQDVTVRRLEKRIHEIEAEKQAELAARETFWAQRVDQVRGETDGRIQSLQEQVSKHKREYDLVVEEAKSVQKATLVEKSRYEETIGSKNSEIENLRRQVDHLKEEQVRLNTAVASSASSSNINLYKDIISQSEDRISKLQTELEEARTAAVESRANEEKAKGDLTKETARLSSEIKATRESFDKVISEMSSVSPQEPVKDLTDIPGIVRKLVSIRNEQEGKEKTLQKELKNLQGRNAELEAAIVKANTELEQHKASFKDIPISSNSNEIEMTNTSSAADSSDMVSILTSQRDRFRSRSLELETERDQLKQGQLDLSNKINILMGDMRRIEQERNFWRSSSQNKSSSNSDVESGGHGRNSGSVTPPVLFSKLKKAATGGGDFEQAATSLVVYGIGNPIIRRVSLAYLLTLHILVFMVLYRLSSIVSTDSSNQ